jgi:hypothetical protein
MQMGEKIAVAGLLEELEKEKCPFTVDVKGADATEDENIVKDDRDSIQGVQANNGGTLGKNLTDGSNGTDNTWKGAPHEPSAQDKTPPKDSKRKDGNEYAQPWAKVLVAGTKTIDEGTYPYTVAAHHLIPGNASLYNSANDLQQYMIKGKTIESKDGKKWKIKYHIGYNVNGAHNGVWLPGNYAIRVGASPTGVSWGKMGNDDWQLNYVAACAKVAKGQFHDAHTDYSDSVRDLLNKIAEKLNYHQCNCELCKSVTEVSPPYLIKQRLYNLSHYFRFNLTMAPGKWRRPWFASDRWRDVVFENSAVKPCMKFVEAYSRARRIETENSGVK